MFFMVFGQKPSKKRDYLLNIAKKQTKTYLKEELIYFFVITKK